MTEAIIVVISALVLVHGGLMENRLRRLERDVSLARKLATIMADILADEIKDGAE